MCIICCKVYCVVYGVLNGVYYTEITISTIIVYGAQCMAYYSVLIVVYEYCSAWFII